MRSLWTAGRRQKASLLNELWPLKSMLSGEVHRSLAPTPHWLTESVLILVLLPSHHLSALWQLDASMEAPLYSSQRNPALRASKQRHKLTNHCPGSCQSSPCCHRWWPSLWICNVLVWHRDLFLSLCLADSCNGLPEWDAWIPEDYSKLRIQENGLTNTVALHCGCPRIT